ncbi:MAG: hypothetical protein R3F59_32260 [Myxococcota bacterium]
MRLGLEAALLGLAACGTETGNPDLLALSYNARTTAPAEVSLERDDPGAADAEQVWLRLGPVRLEGDCDSDPVQARYDALGFADHAHPDAAVQALAVTAATVCRVETSFDAGPASSTGLDAASVALAGTLSDGRAFEVLLDEAVALSFSLDDEPLPDRGGWLLSFDVATWIDADALLALPGDPVTVTAADHADVLDALHDRLRDGVALHHDADGDGQVDPGERRLDR